MLLLSMPGGSEWILIVLAVLILFGGRKIPEFMRGIGKGIREFNDAKQNVKKEIEDGMNEKEKKPQVSLLSRRGRRGINKTSSYNVRKP